MQRYVAFLRGINLGNRRPPMSQLRELFQELDRAEVETFIASVNVIFSSREKDKTKLETQIARHLEQALSYRVDTFVRTAEEVVALGKAKIFQEDGQEGRTIHVGFLHEKLPPKVARDLVAIHTAEDEFQVKGGEYYWLCRIRTNESKVWTLPEMKALRLPTSSMRNISSVRKLIAKHFN